jgi:LPXTG-motif cell wall-anchored protein
VKRIAFVSAGTVVPGLVAFVMGGTSAASILGAVGHINPLGASISKVEGATVATAVLPSAVLPSTSTIDSLPTAFLALGLLAAAAGFALIQRRRTP